MTGASLSWRTLATLIGLVLVALLALPIVALQAAQESLGAIPVDQVALDVPAPSTEWSAPRALPLLTDATREAWLADPGSALSEALVAVVGPEGSATMQALAPRANDWALRHASNAEAGEIPGFLRRTSEQWALSSAEPTAIADAAGLLLLDATRSGSSLDPASSRLVAVMLLSRQAELTPGCDSLTSWAHALSLQQQSDARVVRDAFVAAESACPTDLTPWVEHAYFELYLAAPGGCDAVAPRPPDFGEAIAAFQAISYMAPEQPAGPLGLGDTYFAAARALRPWAVQPFTVRELDLLAEQAYAESIARGAVAGRIGQARAQLNAGDHEAAAATLAESDGPREGVAAELEVEIAAARRDYATAAELMRAIESTPEPATAAVTRATIGQPFDTAELLGRPQTRGAELSVVAGGCGASLAQDLGAFPQSRGETTASFVTQSLGLSALAEQWGARCSRLDPVCRWVKQEGDVTRLSTRELDVTQDLYRRYGEVEAAVGLLTDRAAAYPEEALTAERLGEVLFALGRFDESAAASERAVALYAESSPSELSELWGTRMTGPAWAALRAELAGQAADSDPVDLDALDSGRELQAATLGGDELLDYYLSLATGDELLRQKRYAEALIAYDEALRLGDRLEDPRGSGLLVIRGSAAQSASEAALRLGDRESAIRYAERAVAVDPRNPLFRESLAEALRGQSAAAAIAHYETVLADEPSLFSSWNNLGVLRAANGDREGAVAAFRTAVSVRPDYATAWFNLGVALAEDGWASYLPSQGAYGEAGRLDRQTRLWEKEYVFDDTTYATTLDLSRPVSAEWTLGASVQPVATFFTWGLVLIIGWRAVWALGSDWLLQRALVGAFARRGRWLAKVRIGSSGWLTAGVSLAGLVVVFGQDSVADAVLVCIGVAAAMAAYVVAPRIVGHTLRHVSSVPASVATVAVSAVGWGFAPPPPRAERGVEESATDSRAAVGALGIVGAAAAAVSALTAVPLAHQLAAGTVVLVSSALIPVAPFDGVRLRLGRLGEVLVTAAMAAATAALALGWF